MASNRILTVFGATGKQGGSVIDVVLASPELRSTYTLRGITRDTSSAKSQDLTKRGVEMVQGELDDIESLKQAVKGSYGVFGVTDFWAVMSKDTEIQQGKNIFEAAKSQGVHHYIWSSLPYAEKLTAGVLKHVDHFDGKAIVEAHIEANKGDMLASYFMPAMFMDIRNLVKTPPGGTPALSLPFPDGNVPWPLIEPRHDAGKYVMGMFEGGASADGVKVHGVSTWTTPNAVVAALSRESGSDVRFNAIPAEVFAGFLPERVRKELLETMLLVGNYSYYGKGAENLQDESAKWLMGDANLLSYEQWAKVNAPYQF